MAARVGVPRRLSRGAEGGLSRLCISGPDSGPETHNLSPTAVIDATGNPGSMTRCFDLVAHGGQLVFVGLFQGDVTFNDPNFHRREMSLHASRNALPEDFERIIIPGITHWRVTATCHSPSNRSGSRMNHGPRRDIGRSRYWFWPSSAGDLPVALARNSNV